MKEAVDNTKDTVKAIQADFGGSLLKAIEICDAARLDAEEKLNALRKNLDNMVTNERKTSSIIPWQAILYMLWAFAIISTSFVVGYGSGYGVYIKSLIEDYKTIIGEYSYALPTHIAFFTAAALYPVVTFFSYRPQGNAKKKVTLVDKGCQTDGSPGLECVIVRGINDGGEDMGSVKSISSAVSVSSTGSCEHGEFVHFEVYVTVMKKVGAEWKNFGSQKMSISTIEGSHSLVFRNDIGVVHLNLPIAKGMEFERIVDRENGGAFIRFASIEDGAEGFGTYLLKISPKLLDKVHSKLVELAE